MSVLQALVAHNDRMLENGEAPEYGYSHEAISFAVTLSSDGDVVDFIDLRELSGKSLRPSRRLVPQPAKRSVNIASNTFWDKTAYALGATRDQDSETPVPSRRGEHEEFKRLHLDLLAQTEDVGLRALALFVEKWDPVHFSELHHAEEMLDANVIFDSMELASSSTSALRQGVSGEIS